MKSTAPNVPRDEFGFLLGQKGFRSRNQGSGIIMDEEGYTLTNYHVIERATSITVGLPEGRTVQAQFIGGDSLTDLALIKIESPGLIAAEWGDSDTLEVGSLVWAVGSPFGFEQSITAGILSAKNRPGLVSPHQRFLQRVQPQIHMSVDLRGPLLRGLSTLRRLRFQANRTERWFEGPQP